jgi:hypothetical protein
MWIGAFFVTVYVGLFLAPQVVMGISSLRSNYDMNFLALIVLALAAVVLVGWCDLALVVDARRARRAAISIEQNVPRAVHIVVWLAALFLTILTGWYARRSVLAYRDHGRLDILLVGIVFGIAVVFFDTKIIIDAIRGRHMRRS